MPESYVNRKIRYFIKNTHRLVLATAISMNGWAVIVFRYGLGVMGLNFRYFPSKRRQIPEVVSIELNGLSYCSIVLTTNMINRGF